MAEIKRKRGRPAKRQPYRDQQGGQRRESMQKLNEFVATTAGGDYETIFGEFILKKSAKQTAKEKAQRLLDLLSTWKPLRAVIEGIKNACNPLPTFHKRQMISIVRASGFSRETMELLGWRIGPECTILLFFTQAVSIANITFVVAWATAGKHLKEVGAGKPVPGFQPHHKVPMEIKRQIRDFFYSPTISKPNPSRMCWVKDLEGQKQHVPVRDLLLPVCKIFKAFANQYSKQVEDKSKPANHPERFIMKPSVGMSTFYLLKPAECKKPTRATGMFEILFFNLLIKSNAFCNQTCVKRASTRKMRPIRSLI